MSNSLTELNNFSNQTIVFEDNRPYTIEFSANAAANTNISVTENQIFTVPTGIDIVSITAQPGNITYSIDASAVANVIATWPDPLPAGISNTSSGNTYSITGSFNSDSWNVARNLSFVSVGQKNNYTLPATLTYPDPANVSQNSTWSWTNTVEIVEITPVLSLQTQYSWDEDQSTLLVFSILGNETIDTYTLTFTQTAGPSGVITINGDSAGIGNAATITGTLSEVNLAEVIFYPVPDSTANVTIAVTATRTNPIITETFADNVQCTLTNVSTHNEFALTTNYNYTEDQIVPIAFEITDTAPSAEYTLVIEHVAGSLGAFYVNNVLQPPLTGSITLTGSRSAVNSNTVAFLPFADDVEEIILTYSQSKTSPFFGNTVQANSVPLTLVCTSQHSDFNFPTTGTYQEDNFLEFGNIITDIDPRAESYTISIQQTGGTPGTWYINNAFAGPATTAFVVTDSQTAINAKNISFFPEIDDTSELTFVYSQTKQNSVFGTIPQAVEVTAVYTCIPNTEIVNMIDRSYTTNRVNNIFANSTPVIDDGIDLGQLYTITLESSLGKFGVGTIAEINSQSFYTFTGTMSQVNAQFASMKFVPPVDSDGASGTFTYTQSRNGVLQVNRTLQFTGIDQPFVSTHSFSGTGTYSYVPTEEEKFYGSNMRVIGVGAGGGGGCRNISPLGGGGGMGGQVVIEDWGNFTGTQVIFSINNGGTGSTGSPFFSGTGGFDTLVRGYQGGSIIRELRARGGKPGSGISAQPTGTAPANQIESIITPDGSTVYFGGGSVTSGSSMWGGGGPGAGGNGGAASVGSSGAPGSGYVIPNIGVQVSRGGGGAGADRAVGIAPGEPGSGGGAGRFPTAATNGRPGAGYIIWT